MVISGSMIFADNGKALKPIGSNENTTITRVSLSSNDSTDNWEDCDYEEREDGEHMKYSTLSIKRELAKLGKWDAAKALLEASGYWDDYVLANYLSETDEVFKTACAALVARGIVTDAELKALLPKCLWTAE